MSKHTDSVTSSTAVDNTKPPAPLANVTRKARLTIPRLTLTKNPHMYVQVRGTMHKIETVDKVTGEVQEATLLPIIDLQSGEEAELYAPAVLESTLEEMEGGYQGKKYEIIQKPKADGKRYHTVEVWEIE